MNVPSPLFPGADPGVARELVWGMPWRSNVEFVGQAYCVGGKSLYWGGWCPRLLDTDLANWPPTVAQYLMRNYPLLERQTGVSTRTDFIQGPLFEMLKAKSEAAVAHGIPNLNAVEEPPLAVQGQSPGSGLFSFDKYSSITVLMSAVREAAAAPDSQRRLFLVANAHVSRLDVRNGAVSGIAVRYNGRDEFLGVDASCPVILALGTVESTRLALASFPTSNDPANELMGRNLMVHIRTNTYARLRRAVFDPGKTLPTELQTGALLVRGATATGKFHLQVTASADIGYNSDVLLFSMIPDIDQLDALLGTQQSDWISVAVRAVGETVGDKTSPAPNDTGRWINLSPFERDEFGVPRAYVRLSTTPSEETVAAAMDTATNQLLASMVNYNPADLAILSQSRDGLGTTYHEAGTLWMGTEPHSSVTDPNGRFHNVVNAYCADQSLFVTVGSVNPTLTGLVLARRVAQAAVAQATGAAPPL